MPAAGPGAGTEDVPPADILDTPEAGALVVRGGALRTLAYLAGVLLSLAAVPLMARHLGPADFGWFVAVTSLLAIAGGLADAGLATIGLREYATRDVEGRERLMRNLLGIRVVFTAVGVCAAVVFAAAGYPLNLVAGTLLAGAALMLTDLQRVAKIPLASTLRLGWVAGLELLTQAVLVATMILLVALGAGLLPFFAAAVVAGAVGLAVTLLVSGKTVPVVPALERPEWRRLLHETLPYAIALAIGVASYRLTLIVLSLIAPEEQTGFFATAFRIFEVLGGIAVLMVGSVFPILARAARDDEGRFRYALGRVLDVVTLVGVGIAVLVFVGASLAVDVIGGAAYEPAVPVLRIAAGALVGFFVAVTLQYALVAIHRQRALLLTNAAALVVALTLSIALGAVWEAEGAAVALTASQCLPVPLYGFFLVRARPALGLTLRVVPRVALAAALAGSVGMLAPVSTAAAVVLSAVTYLAVLLVLRAVPEELLDALPFRSSAGGPK